MRKFLVFLASFFILATTFSGCVKIVEDDDDDNDSSLCISLPSRGTRIMNPVTGRYYSNTLDHCNVAVYHSNGKIYIYDTTTEILYIDNLEDGGCSIRVQAIDRNGNLMDQVRKNYVKLEEDETSFVTIKF